MRIEKNVLFGIDDSDFAWLALVGIGGLLRNSRDIKMTLFHGATGPNLPLLLKVLNLSPEATEKHQKLWSLEAQKVLERAKEGLTESGFDSDMVSSIFEKKCNDPAGAMLKLADSEGIETLAVARWGKETVSRQVMGSVTYRLAQMADNLALWVIEPRICYHNVLVGLVEAPISHRVVDHAARYFSHLRESRFTLFHVIPPEPPQCWNSAGIIDKEGPEEHQKKIAGWLKEYTERVREIANEAKERLIIAGVPEQNVVFKFQRQEKGIARDILAELELGNNGILVIGRKGSKDIREFGLGSKANKLLHTARAFVVCLVS